MQDQLAKLEEFHETFRCFIRYEPVAAIPDEVADVRIRLFEEELAEYRRAVAKGDIPPDIYRLSALTPKSPWGART
jgi:hypothetical protein